MELRAEGFALKTESPVQLIEAMRQVLKGRIIFPAAAQRWLMNQGKQETNKSATELSPREWEVIACTARHDEPEIARSLGVSANTVRFHLKSIFGKTSGDQSHRSCCMVLRAQRWIEVICL